MTTTVKTLVAMALLASLALSAVPVVEAAEKTETVKFNMAHAVAYLALMVAEKKGLFREEGLEIQSVRIAEAGMTNIQAVLSGTLDVGFGSSHALLQTLAQGGPIVALSIYAGGADSNAFIARKDSGIKSAHDLVGKKIGFEQGGLIQQLVYTLLAREGVDRSQVQMVPVNAVDMPAAIVSKSVDAVVVYEPYASAIVDGGSGYEISRMGKYLQEQPRFIFFNKPWVAKNPEATRRFLTAVHRAMQWVRQQPPIESAKVAAEYLKQPPETLAKSIKWYTWDPRITESTLRLVDADQGFLQELKRLTRPVNPRDGFDLSFQAKLLRDRPQLYSDLK